MLAEREACGAIHGGPLLTWLVRSADGAPALWGQLLDDQGCPETTAECFVDSGDYWNAPGAGFTEQPSEARMVLAVELAELSRANIGSMGGYIIIRYRATWLTGKGTKVASLVGVAEPRNPSEPGPRHLEDVIEVMYEEMVQGLEKAQGIKTR